MLQMYVKYFEIQEIEDSKIQKKTGFMVFCVPCVFAVK
jgi:hypothetical protein